MSETSKSERVLHGLAACKFCGCREFTINAVVGMTARHDIICAGCWRNLARWVFDPDEVDWDGGPNLTYMPHGERYIIQYPRESVEQVVVWYLTSLRRAIHTEIRRNTWEGYDHEEIPRPPWASELLIQGPDLDGLLESLPPASEVIEQLTSRKFYPAKENYEQRGCVWPLEQAFVLANVDRREDEPDETETVEGIVFVASEYRYACINKPDWIDEWHQFHRTTTREFIGTAMPLKMQEYLKLECSLERSD